MARLGKREACKCIDSLQVEIGDSLKTLFKRKEIYCVVITIYKNQPHYIVYGRSSIGWNYHCEQKEFEDHFILLKNSKTILNRVKVNGGEIPRDL